MRYNKKKFIYLISPPKIERNFFKDLNEVLKQKKTSFFQLRLKKNSFKKKLIIGRKIQKICKKFKVKFIINDDVYLAKKLTTRSLPEIGRRFANRDHTTVIHAVKTITRLSEQDDEMKKNINQIKSLLLEQ